MRPFVGTVVSAGVNLKTVKVQVAKQMWNDYLRKNFAGFKNYMAHDEYNACKTGDVVRITPDGKLSKRKRYTVLDVITPYGTGERIPPESAEQREKRKEQERQEQILKKTAKLERRAERERQEAELREKWRPKRKIN